MTAAATGQYPATLAEALAVFQASPLKISKGNTADVKNEKGQRLYSYTYADLADVNEEVLPRLGAVGLAFTSRPTMLDGQFVLAYSLIHVSGEREDGVYPLPSANGKPQAIGGAITYARRYCLCAVTGIAAAGDDDDAGAAQAEHRQSAGGVFEQSAPTRPNPPGNSAPRGQVDRPAVQAVPEPDTEIDDEAQKIADEAHACRGLAELKTRIYVTAEQRGKLGAYIADPGTGMKGQLGPYLNFRRKALEATDAAWADLYKAAEALHMDVGAVEDHVRKVAGKVPEAATAVDVRKAIDALGAAAE